jgi:tetrapyrrole methylase family protein/MazG family protein
MTNNSQKFIIKDKYSMEELRELMAFLRSPQGCPWDREQSHDSIKKNLLEEAYEAIDAIDSEQPERICDELGDVLMQVVFHAQMAAEEQKFDFDDVISGICRKLISRHTHIFGDDNSGSASEVLDLWEKNKKKEKGLSSQSQVLKDVPRSLPALQRSYKVQQKAAKSGFDWADKYGPLGKIHEELDEIARAEVETETAVRNGQMSKEQAGRIVAGEVGDFLFAAVNYARHLQVQPEMALSGSTEKFIRRFASVEDLARVEGLNMEEMSLAELDALWDRVKLAEQEKQDET